MPIRDDRLRECFQEGLERGRRSVDERYRRDSYINTPVTDPCDLGKLAAMVQRVIDNSRNLKLDQLLALSDQLLRADAITRRRLEEIGRT